MRTTCSFMCNCFIASLSLTSIATAPKCDLRNIDVETVSDIVVEAEYMLVSHNFAPERANQTYFKISVILLLLSIATALCRAVRSSSFRFASSSFSFFTKFVRRYCFGLALNLKWRSLLLIVPLSELRMVTQNGAQTALLKLSTKVFVRETVRHLQGGQQLVLQS